MNSFPTKPTGQPIRFYLNNDLFDGTDALVAYCMVRHFQPRLIIEIGGGFSSLILGEAAAKNKSSALICIEAFSQEFLIQGFPGLHSLIDKKAEDVGITWKISKLRLRFHRGGVEAVSGCVDDPRVPIKSKPALSCCNEMPFLVERINKVEFYRKRGPIGAANHERGKSFGRIEGRRKALRRSANSATKLAPL